MPRRNLLTHPLPRGSPNSLSYWNYTRNPIRIAIQFTVIQVVRILPSLAAKRVLLRLLGMKVGHNVSIAALATFDFMFPELIELKDNCIIGYNAMILAHEFLPDSWKTGTTVIGENCLIGANSLVLAGVQVGRDSIVSAMTLVDRPIPANSFAKGNPIKVVRKRK